MHIARIVLACSLILAFGFSTASAAEDEAQRKPVKAEKKAEKKTQKVSEAKPEKVKEEREVVREDRSFGDKFTGFWVHTVGGSIGNGLKKGAKKISNAF